MGRSPRSWRRAARAVLQLWGRACGRGTGVSACGEGKEGEKGHDSSGRDVSAGSLVLPVPLPSPP